MSEDRIETEIAGREVDFEYAESWIGYSILSLRLVMGWVFLQSGIQKFLAPDWSAEGFLMNVPDGNPFGFWTMLAGDPVVDALVIYGQLAIGTALLLGFLVRFTALMGGLQMLAFWAASLEGGLMDGLPVAHGYVVSNHIVYLLLLFGLGAFGAGRIVGIDTWIENTDIVERHEYVFRHLTG